MIRRIAAATIFAALCSSSALAKPFTGTFVADARPLLMALLSLTEADEVTGFLVIAVPDGNGRLSSETVALKGSSYEKQVTLETKTFFNLANVTMTGRIHGRTLLLSYPTASGEVGTVTFVRGVESTFNKSLAAWQTHLKEVHAAKQLERRAIELREEKARAALEFARELENTTDDLSRQLEILKAAHTLIDDLTACGAALRTMKEFSEKVDTRTGNIACSYLGDQLSYAHDQLERLRDIRDTLEDHAQDVEGHVAELRLSSAEIERLIAAFRTSVANDPARTIKAADADALINSVRVVLSASPQILANTLRDVSTSRRAGDDVVRNGANLYTQTADRVENARCRRE